MKIMRPLIFLKRSVTLVLVLFPLMAWGFSTVGPVRSGQTLWSIASALPVAQQVGVHRTIQALEKLNADTLAGGILSVGSKLKVPTTVGEVNQVLNQASVNHVAQPRVITAQVAQKHLAASPINAAMTPSAGKVAKTAATLAQTHATSAGTIGLHETNTAQVAVTNYGSMPVQSDQPKTNLSLSVAPPVKSHAVSDHFSWGWVWFIAFVALCFWFVRARRSQMASAYSRSQTMAAERLGIRRNDPVAKFTTQRFAHFDRLISSARAQFKSRTKKEDAECEKTLLSHIADQPKVVELRVKLLEFYVKTNQQAAFKQQADYLLQNLIDESDPAWARVRALYLSKWAYDSNSISDNNEH